MVCCVGVGVWRGVRCARQRASAPPRTRNALTRNATMQPRHCAATLRQLLRHYRAHCDMPRAALPQRRFAPRASTNATLIANAATPRFATRLSPRRLSTITHRTTAPIATLQKQTRRRQRRASRHATTKCATRITPARRRFPPPPPPPPPLPPLRFRRNATQNAAKKKKKR